ncbi:IS91 family transposase, partial [Desulfobotulus mexicanus]
CGHRNCPQCQHHEASQWIERQQEKLLPVEYFMVTFTLPYELRELTYWHQKIVFSLFFLCVSSTLKDFGLKPKNLGAEIGMTMVLHTHSRRLDYHPHLHVVIPGGGIDKLRKQWKKIKGKYLFNDKALAKVFRARFLDALNKEGLTVPTGIRSKWVVQCKGVGKGLPAIKYLSRYLYRGVISEKNIISSKDGMVTFRYTENTGKIQYRTLKGEDFLRLILKHVLPKGFRRIRDYGFLHSKAKKLLSLVQYVLRVQLESITPVPRASFSCPRCKAPMEVLFFLLRPG